MSYRICEPAIRCIGTLLVFVCVSNITSGVANAQDSSEERQYVQLLIVGKLNANNNSVSSLGKPNQPPAIFALDFSKSPRLKSTSQRLKEKVVIVRGLLVPCTTDGDDGTPKCDRERSRNGLFLQPLSVKEFQKPGGQVSEKDHVVSVVCRGRIHTDVVALGGETTGFTIELTPDGDKTWELELQNKLADSARKSDNRTVVISGTLTVRKGIAIRERWIIAVRNLIAG